MLTDAKCAAMIAVKDLDEAKAWYTDTLGLKVTKEDPGGIQFDCGAGTSLNIYPSQFAGTAKNTVAGFDVGDVEGTVEKLRARGVTFEEYDMPGLKTENGIAQIEGWRGAWFKDPDGNILGIGSEA